MIDNSFKYFASDRDNWYCMIIVYFKKRQQLITISGDESGIFHFKGQRYLNS